jgi:hypothetical protein
VRPPRSFAFACACAVAACLGTSTYPQSARAEERSKTPDLVRARELDVLGVRAFKDGRYRDAIRFFTEAYRLGAPSSELWNIARCRKKLDEPEEEIEAIKEYLAQQDLSTEERAEATKELGEVRGRHSTVSIDSSPSGGVVLIDGRRVGGSGTTPLSVSVAPGTHKIRVEKRGAGAYETEVDAKYGRAVIVTAALEPTDDDAGPNGDPRRKPAASAPSDRRIAISLEGGYFVPRLSGYSAPLAPSLHLAARYAFVLTPTAFAQAGVRLGWTQDRWASGTLAEPSPTGCTLPRSFVANDLSVLAVVGGGVRLGARTRLGGELGLGLDALTGSEAGGEVFAPTCTPSFGARVLGHASLEASYAIVPALRVVLSPVVFQIHPAFSGTRSAPVDTTGAWWRIGSAVGLAVDL